MKKKIITICIFIIVISPALVSALTVENHDVNNRKGQNETLIGEKDVILSDEITWMKIFRRLYDDLGAAVHQTNDGGYIVIGTTNGIRCRSAWLIKIDMDGNEEWNKTYGGPNVIAQANDGLKTSDGGYVFFGYYWGYSFSDFDAWLVKTDENGDVEWSKTYGGPKTELGFSVKQTSDGGFILNGMTESSDFGRVDYWLIKTDQNGNELWNKTFDCGCCSVIQTSDGGYMIAGWIDIDWDNWCDAIIIKTDSNGNEEWRKTFGGSGEDWVGWIKQTSDGGYIILGESESFEFGGYGSWLIRTNSEGNELWNNTYGSCFPCGDVHLTSDGGFVFVDSINGVIDRKIRVVKVGMYGHIRWIRLIGTPSDDWVTSSQQTNDGGYIIVGETNHDVYIPFTTDILVIKIDKNGRCTSMSNDFNKISMRPFLKQNFLHYFKLYFLNLL